MSNFIYTCTTKVTECLLHFSTCAGGEWTCVTQSCPATCSIEGGSHITTYDEKYYSFYGDCSYVLTKVKGVTFLAKVIC